MDSNSSPLSHSVGTNFTTSNGGFPLLHSVLPAISLVISTADQPSIATGFITAIFAHSPLPFPCDAPCSLLRVRRCPQLCTHDHCTVQTLTPIPIVLPPPLQLLPNH
ncbi:hypothetical protein LguiA_013912 [Lonicera macranthoides]